MKHTTSLQTGLITGLIMVLASLFSLYILKNPVESYFQVIVYIIFAAGIVWSLVNYSRSERDNKTFSAYFSTGFKTFVVITLIMAVFAYIYFSLNTVFRDNKIAENSRLLLLEGNHLPAEIEDNARQLKKMYIPMMLSAAIFRYLILGAIITGIAAFFLSNKEKNPQQPN
jgi:Protein of unknown function (DUF4199)